MKRTPIPTRMTALLPALLLAACSSAPKPACIANDAGERICTLTDHQTGLTTRTIERQGRLFVSTCQMSQCGPFMEIGTARDPAPVAAPTPVVIEPSSH